MPILRATGELPQSSAVLARGPWYLEGMAESPHARAMVQVGAVHRNPAAASVVATPDYTLLGSWYLLLIYCDFNRCGVAEVA